MSKSDAYMNGWADASALYPRKNPYEVGSDEHSDYEYGYTMSMQENG